MISIMKNISVSVFSPPPPPPSLSYIILEKSAGMLPNSEQYCMKNVGGLFSIVFHCFCPELFENEN